MRYASPYVPMFILSMVFAVITVATTLYAPILIGRAVDVMIGKDNVDLDKLTPIVI